MNTLIVITMLARAQLSVLVGDAANAEACHQAAYMAMRASHYIATCDTHVDSQVWLALHRCEPTRTVGPTPSAMTAYRCSKVTP